MSVNSRSYRPKDYLSDKIIYEKFIAMFPPSVTEESQLIDHMLQDLNIDTAIYQKQPKLISLRHSDSEEWYFQQLFHWLDCHPEAIGTKFNRSEIYRFALHFFVENIALNAANAKLKYGELTQKVNALALKQENAKLEAQLANMENLLRFLTTLQYRQLEYIPEKINLQNRLVDYSINPINETEFQKFGAPT